MCIGGGSSKPAVDPNDKIAADNKAAEEQRKKELAKAKRTEEQVARKKVGGGAGKRSLFTGKKAGLGYYDETL